MTVVSGKFATVNGVSTTAGWSVNYTRGNARYRASNTFGGSGRKRGLRDWTGSVRQYGGLPWVMPGANFQFDGYAGPDTGVFGTVGKRYHGLGIVDSISVAWNFDGTQNILSTINFSGNGPFTDDVAAAYADNTTPAVFNPAEDGIVFTVGGPAEGGFPPTNRICGIRTATLTITSENQQYADSCGEGWMLRKPGPLDWTLATQFNDTDPRDALGGIDLGDTLRMCLYTVPTTAVPVSAGAFWDLQWAMMRDMTGINADNETGAIVGATVNFDMAAYNDGGTLGFIRYPGNIAPALAWWPPVAA